MAASIQHKIFPLIDGVVYQKMRCMAIHIFSTSLFRDNQTLPLQRIVVQKRIFRHTLYFPRQTVMILLLQLSL